MLGSDVTSVGLGALLTILASGVTIYFSRRFNLPGLGREIQGQQTALIDVYKDRIEALESDNEALKDRLTKLEACEDDRAQLRGQVASLTGDIARLYRRLGEKPPAHLKSTMVDVS